MVTSLSSTVICDSVMASDDVMMPRAVFKASSRDFILHYLAQVFLGETNIGLNLSIFVRAVKLWLLLKLIIKIYQTICNKITRKVSICYRFQTISTPLKLCNWDTLKGGKFLCPWNNARHYLYEDGTLFEHNLLCGTLPSLLIHWKMSLVVWAREIEVCYFKKMNYIMVGNAEYR